MKKIAIITKNTTFNKYFGGLEVHTKALIENLSSDYQVDVFAPKRELKNLFVKENNKNFYFLECEYKTGFISDLSKNNWYHGLLTFFEEKYHENKYDLIISISSAGYPIIRNKAKYKPNIITICHGSAYSEFKSLYNEQGLSFSFFKNLPYFLYNYFFKQPDFIRNSDFVVSVSSYVQASIVKETGALDLAKFNVIHNGAKLEAYQKDFSRTNSLKVLFSGRIEKSKGIFILLQSIKDLNIKLLIAGDGSMLEQAKQLQLDLQIQDKVVFLGKLNYPQLTEYYKECDLLVAPSLRIEGFPMSIVEAMGYYMPIIATKIGGNDDAVFENRNGFLISPGDIDELKERIKFFDTYPEKIKEYGLNSRNLAVQKFNQDFMINEYKNLIERFII
jgi:glycosyltransferase involved in cell wall biosynthesis